MKDKIIKDFQKFSNVLVTVQIENIHFHNVYKYNRLSSLKTIVEWGEDCDSIRLVNLAGWILTFQKSLKTMVEWGEDCDSISLAVIRLCSHHHTA